MKGFFVFHEDVSALSLEPGVVKKHIQNIKEENYYFFSKLHDAGYEVFVKPNRQGYAHTEQHYLNDNLGGYPTPPPCENNYVPCCDKTACCEKKTEPCKLDVLYNEFSDDMYIRKNNTVFSTDEYLDVLGQAWEIIANVEWNNRPKHWRVAAERFREKYFKFIEN